MQKCRCDDRGKEDNRCFLAMIHKMHCPVGADCGHCQKWTFTAFFFFLETFGHIFRLLTTGMQVVFFLFMLWHFQIIPVPHDHQLFDILLRVEHQIHLGFFRADARVLSRVWEQTVGHRQARAELRRSAGSLWEPVHEQSGLWELCYLWSWRLRFLLFGEFITYTIIRYNKSIHSSNESWC